MAHVVEVEVVFEVEVATLKQELTGEEACYMGACSSYQEVEASFDSSLNGGVGVDNMVEPMGDDSIHMRSWVEHFPWTVNVHGMDAADEEQHSLGNTCRKPLLLMCFLAGDFAFLAKKLAQTKKTVQRFE